MGHAVVVQRQLSLHKFGRFFAQTGNQDGFLPVIYHGLRNAQNMLLGLPCAVNHLGHALTNATVKIHLCVFADFLEGLYFQLERRIIRADAPVRHMIQKFSQFMLIHHVLLYVFRIRAPCIRYFPCYLPDYRFKGNFCFHSPQRDRFCQSSPFCMYSSLIFENEFMLRQQLSF